MQVSGSFINKSELKQNQNPTPNHIIAKVEKNTIKKNTIWAKEQNTVKETASKTDN